MYCNMCNECVSINEVRSNSLTANMKTKEKLTAKASLKCAVLPI